MKYFFLFFLLFFGRPLLFSQELKQIITFTYYFDIDEQGIKWYRINGVGVNYADSVVWFVDSLNYYENSNKSLSIHQLFQDNYFITSSCYTNGKMNCVITDSLYLVVPLNTNSGTIQSSTLNDTNSIISYSGFLHLANENQIYDSAISHYCNLRLLLLEKNNLQIIRFLEKNGELLMIYKAFSIDDNRKLNLLDYSDFSINPKVRSKLNKDLPIILSFFNKKPTDFVLPNIFIDGYWKYNYYFCYNNYTELQIFHKQVFRKLNRIFMTKVN